MFTTSASGSNSLQTISSISRAVEEAVHFKMQFRSFWNQRILDLSLQCELRNYFWLLYPQPIKEHCLHTRLAGKRNRPRTEAMEYWLRSNILKWERPMWVCVYAVSLCTAICEQMKLAISFIWKIKGLWATGQKRNGIGKFGRHRAVLRHIRHSNAEWTEDFRQTINFWLATRHILIRPYFDSV